MNRPANLSAFDSDSGDLNVIIDTPQKSRNKYEYDEKLKLFKLVGSFGAQKARAIVEEGIGAYRRRRHHRVARTGARK